MHHIAEGMKVISSEGAELGTVREVEEDRFKIEGRMATDYWVPCDSVAEEVAVDNALRLGITESEVELMNSGGAR